MLKSTFASMLPMIKPDRYKGSSLCHSGDAGRRWGHMASLELTSTLWVLLLCCFCSRVHGDLAADANGLTIFKQAVDGLNTLAWNASSDVCTWPGIECKVVSTLTSSRVTKVKLSKGGLSGPIPAGSLSQLTELRALNLRLNNLSGSLPSDLENCRFVRSIYLQNNRLSGLLPSNFSSWPNLVHFDVSFNNFSGGVSPSLTESTQLKSLYLQNNTLTGSLPPLNMSSLTGFNASNNHFTGTIPATATYQKFDQSAFLGNNLCGFPLSECAPVPAPFTIAVPPIEGPPNKKKKLSGGAIAGIVVGGVVFLLLVCLLCCLSYKKTKSRGTNKQANAYEARSVEGNNHIDAVAAPKGEMGSGVAAVPAPSEPDRNRLIFFDGNKYGFDLEDLLRASAEVLGKGSVGTSYKAVLESGTIVTVKRLKDVSIEKKDFDLKMQFFGKLKHENLVPVIAYYYSREEKLLVSIYMTNGSLSALLHGNKEANSTPLDWDTRVRIALGAALGIQHLHEKDFTHGNIKSSNVLLTSNYTGCVSDYGLTQLVSASAAANRTVGYRAPEMTDIRKPTPKTDVYSFGVLLLELLTGKPPSMSGEGRDLPLWVQSVSKDEEDWYSKVFDPQLTRFEGVEDEMERVLNIALKCVMPSPDQRPTMRELVEKLQNYKQHDGLYPS